MPWAQLDDQFHSHPKVLAVGLAGTGLYARALSYSADHLTDGYVPRAWVTAQLVDALQARLATVTHLEDLGDLATKLEHAGLWISVSAGRKKRPDGYVILIPGDGYLIPDYLDFNPSKADVERLRGQKADRQRRWRERRKGDAPVDASRDAWETRQSRVTPRARTDAPSPTPEEQVDLEGDLSAAAGEEELRPAAADPEHNDLARRLHELDFGDTETTAALADPQRAAAWVRHAEQHAIGSIGGYAWTNFQRGGWPPAPNGSTDEPAEERLVHALELWVVSPEAIEYDERSVREEIATRTRKARADLDDTDLELLLDLWAKARQPA